MSTASILTGLVTAALALALHWAPLAALPTSTASATAFIPALA